jgi:hypothetical protein
LLKFGGVVPKPENLFRMIDGNLRRLTAKGSIQRLTSVARMSYRRRYFDEVASKAKYVFCTCGRDRKLK